MTAKEFMSQVSKAEREMLLFSARRRHYEDLMSSIGANIGGGVHSQNVSSKTETAAVGLVFMTEQLTAKIEEYTALIKKAEELIGKLSQENFRRILTLRYLCAWSWRSIRDEMGYKDEKSVYRCHGYALRELQKVM